MNSSMGLMLTRSRIAPIPLTQFVKNAVEALAVKQGHTRLKSTNKKGIELGNSDWIAGVDCEDDSHNHNENEDDNDSTDSSDEECTPDPECTTDTDDSDDDSNDKSDDNDDCNDDDDDNKAQ